MMARQKKTPSKAKNPVGRPTKYNKKFCDTVIEVGESGGSVMQMAVACGVRKQAMLDWAAKYGEFSDAFTYAKQLSQVWWEKIGQDHIIDTNKHDRETGMSESKRLNSGVYSRSMAARFPDDWREKKEVKQEVNFANDLKSALLDDDDE